jgi:hypothetical protein
MNHRGKNGHRLGRSRATQVVIFAAILVVNATSAFAKGKINQAIQEHQGSRKQLKAAHQELFEKMDRYHEAVSSKTRDPAKIAIAKQEISEANQRVNSILQDAHTRMNTLIQSMKYSIEDGLREKTQEDDDSGTPLPESEVASFIAKNPPPKVPSQASEAAAGAEMGFPNSVGASPRPSPTAPSPEVAAPEIKDQPGPREFVFGKRSAKPSAAAPPALQPSPTPRATPTPRAN